MNPNRIVLTAVLLFSAHAAAQAPDLERMDIVLKSVPNGPIAKVFGQNISAEKFVRVYQIELAQLTAANGGEPIGTEGRVRLARICLRELVEQELLRREGKKRSITISNADAEKAWTDRLGVLRNNLELSGNEASEKAMLRRLGYSSRKDALDEIKGALLILRTRETIIEERGITIDDERVQQIYEMAKGRGSGGGVVHLRQIFIRAEKGEGRSARRQREDARRRAEDTLARIDAGQSFEGIVRSVSEAPDKATGGDLGPAPLEELPAYLAAPAMSLEPDEVSDVIESDTGFHIVKLISRQAANQPDLDQAAPAIRQQLLAREGERAVREYFSDQVRNPDDVQIFLELEKNLLLHPDYRE